MNALSANPAPVCSVMSGRQLVLAHAGLLQHALDHLAQLSDSTPNTILITLNRTDHMTVLADRHRLPP